MHTVAQFESIGSENVLNNCTMYGRIDVMPLNWAMANANRTTANGRIVRLRTNSFIFSFRSGLEWTHFMPAFWQQMHEFEFSE